MGANFPRVVMRSTYFHLAGSSWHRWHCSPFPRLSFLTHHHSLALVFSSIAFARITPLFLLALPPIPDDTLICFVRLGIYPFNYIIVHLSLLSLFSNFIACLPSRQALSQSQSSFPPTHSGLCVPVRADARLLQIRSQLVWIAQPRRGSTDRHRCQSFLCTTALLACFGALQPGKDFLISGTAWYIRREDICPLNHLSRAPEYLWTFKTVHGAH
jgi:hypothetical protein